MTNDQIVKRIEIGWKSMSDEDRTYLSRVLGLLEALGLKIVEKRPLPRS